MADAIVSVVAEQLISTVKEQIQNEIQLVRGVEKELLDLSDKLKKIRNVLDDADRKQFKEKTVMDWLRRLEQTSHEMEDVLEEWNYAILQHKIEYESAPPPKHKVSSFIPSSCFCCKKLVVRRDIAKKIQNLKSRLEEILKEEGGFNFVISQPKNDPSAASWRLQSDSSIDLAKVQGRSDDRDILVKKLIPANEGLSYQIFSIVGAGGLGKTTLAQLIYNDSRVKEYFDLRIWICVSDPFDVAAIAKGIIESITKQSCPDTNQLNVLLERLKDSISDKKILLVLDDVWNQEEAKWEPLQNALKCGGAGSKILVTTRKAQVAKTMGTFDEDIYRPELLSDEDCRLLLMHSALSGRSPNEFEYFEEIGKEIAKKCNGLPLAAKTLGSLLRFKNNIQEWENVLKSEMWELENVKVDLFPHLLLSYHELSPMLKRCFSFCAFFPKDENIQVEKLIRIWMALGYLGSDDVELKGREYFEDLAMRSLFQDFEEDDSTGQIMSCKMHDIVHDFAQFLRKNGRVEAVEMAKRSCQVCDSFVVSDVQEYRSLFWGKESPPNLCDCLTSLRVLRFKKKLENGTTLGMEKLIHLRWLDMSDTKLSKEDLKTICKLYFLRTLLLVDCSLEEIPWEIGNLVKLRHLDLSRNEELKWLPESMCSLVELQTLLLARCSLKEIPGEIGNLVKLRLLNLSRNRELKELPESMRSLLELQTLDIEDCSDLCGGVAQISGLRSLNCCIKLGLLKNLNRLEILELEIKVSSSSEVEELVKDAGEAELRNKIHIQTLMIQFKDENNRLSSSLWVNVIEALEPNQNLKTLYIGRYKGFRLPNWMSSPLNLVREIELRDCTEVSSLPPMGKLPFLEVLYLYNMSGLKLVGREWLDLGIRRGKEGDVRMDIQSSSTTNVVVAFPKLKHLTFSFCPQWCEWEDITAEEEESATVLIMPCLTDLEIVVCGGLKMLPHRLLSKASSLGRLGIHVSSELRKCYEDKDGSPWRSISQCNPQLQLLLD